MEVISVRKRIAALETRIAKFERDMEKKYTEIIRLLERFEGGRAAVRKMQKD